MADDLKNKSVKGMSWSFAEQFLTRGFNLVIGIILARLLSPTDFGLVGMFGIFIAISQLFIDGGLASALIREKKPSEKDFSTVYIVNMTLGVVFYFLLFFSAPLIADFYGHPLMKDLLRVTALILVINPIASIHNTLLIIRVDFKSKMIISITNALASGAVGILCAYKGMGAWALVGQSLTSAVVATLLTLAFVRWMPRLVFSRESFKRLFSYSSKLLGSQLIQTIYANVYPMVIGKKYAASDVGYFNRAGQFPNMTSTAFASAMNQVAFPIMSQIQDDDQRLITVYERYIQVFCFLAFPVLMGLCGCAKPLTSFLLTDKWLPCVPMMQIICFSYLLTGIAQLNLNLFYVKGRSDLVLRMEIIKKALMFGVLIITMFFGMTAICYGLIFNSLIDFFYGAFYTKRILGYSPLRQVKVAFPYLLLSLVVLAESLLISHFIQNNLLSLITSLVVCALSYWALAKMIGPYAYQETATLIRSKLGKEQ